MGFVSELSRIVIFMLVELQREAVESVLTMMVCCRQTTSIFFCVRGFVEHSVKTVPIKPLSQLLTSQKLSNSLNCETDG